MFEKMPIGLYEERHNVTWDNGVYSSDGKINYATTKSIAQLLTNIFKELGLKIGHQVTPDEVGIYYDEETGSMLDALVRIPKDSLISVYTGILSRLENAPDNKKNAVENNNGFNVYPEDRMNLCILGQSFPANLFEWEYYQHDWLSEQIQIANLGNYSIKSPLNVFFSVKEILPGEHMGTFYPLPIKCMYTDRFFKIGSYKKIYTYTYRKNIRTRSEGDREWCCKIVSNNGDYHIASKKPDDFLDKTMEIYKLEYSLTTRSWKVNCYYHLAPTEELQKYKQLKKYLEENLETEVEDLYKRGEKDNFKLPEVQTPASNKKLKIDRTIPVENIGGLDKLLRKLNGANSVEIAEKIANKIAKKVAAYVGLKLPILEEHLDLINTYSLTTVPPNINSLKNTLDYRVGNGDTVSDVNYPSPYELLFQVTFAMRNVLSAISKDISFTPEVGKRPIFAGITNVLIAHLVCGLATIHASALKEMKPSLLQLCRELINQFNAKDLIALLENIDNSFKATMPVPCTRYVTTTPTALSVLHPEMRKVLRDKHKDADWFKSAAHDNYRLNFETLHNELTQELQKQNITLYYKNGFFSPSDSATKKQPYGPYEDHYCFPNDPATQSTLRLTEILQITKKVQSMKL